MDNPKVRVSRSQETFGMIPAKSRLAGTRENLRQTEVTEEERHRLIASRAYSYAEGRGFAPGSELDDWLKAEAEIENMLRKRGDRHSVV